MTFSPEEIERYARHLVLREIGGQGQQRIQAAKVLIIGVGGLGAPAALYLAAAGVGTIGLMDKDVVSLSNLQRQVLYAVSDLGRPKVGAAQQALHALNPGVRIQIHPEFLDQTNAVAVISGYDLVLDGTDRFETRFVVNAACLATGAVLVSGALSRWSGQVAVFAGRPCYQCLVPEPPLDTETCEAVGVMGALGGVIGSMMALETIKRVTGAGDDLTGRLFIYDALKAQSRTVKVSPDPACPACSATGATPQIHA